MFCRNGLNILSAIAAMVYSNIEASFLKVAINETGPGFSPRFDESEVIPGSVFLAETVGPDVAHCQQDVSVGVAPFCMVSNVRDHPGGDKGIPDPGAQQFEVVVGREDQRQCDLHLACQLCVFAGLLVSIVFHSRARSRAHRGALAGASI